MNALFADDECGHRRPEPIRPPSRAERDRATLSAGTHPATGRPLREVRPGEVRRHCRDCRWLDRDPVPRCTGPAGQADDPPRTLMLWPACDLWQADPPPVLAGQRKIGETP